jgi:hypothetical protein
MAGGMMTAVTKSPTGPLSGTWAVEEQVTTITIGQHRFTIVPAIQGQFNLTSDMAGPSGVTLATSPEIEYLQGVAECIGRAMDETLPYPHVPSLRTLMRDVVWELVKSENPETDNDEARSFYRGVAYGYRDVLALLAATLADSDVRYTSPAEKALPVHEVYEFVSDYGHSPDVS